MIQQLLTDYSHLGPLHGKQLVNHLPMAQVALWKMGADEKSIRTYSEEYISRWQIKPAIVSTHKITSIGDAIGETEAYCAYVIYFKKLLKTEGVDSMLRKGLNYLSKGLASGLFHGLIRIAYGLESGHMDEVCRGLALYASIYHETRFAEKTILPEDLQAGLYAYHLDPEAHFYMSGTIEEKEKALALTLSELYLSTGNFIVLHTITGFHALKILSKYYEDYGQVLDRYTVCVQRALRRLPKDMYKKIVLTEANHNWTSLQKEAIQEKDAHTIKFVYTCMELNKWFESEVFLKNANIKLQLG